MEHVICELCPRKHETNDADVATASGWILGWDGWVCPSCNRAINARPSADARQETNNG